MYHNYKTVNKTQFYNKIWLEFRKNSHHVGTQMLIYLVGLGLVADDAMTPTLEVDPTNAAFV